MRWSLLAGGAVLAPCAAYLVGAAQPHIADAVCRAVPDACALRAGAWAWRVGAPPPLGHAPPGGCRRTPPPTMPPKSEPVQSALAPKPRGILKNAKPPADAQEKNKCVDVC